MSVARRHGLKVVEDAAQGVMLIYKVRPLGSIGDLGAYCFHNTKNLISG
jgi:dTDP-4-amino-4,6-dideoxygalactose transaminase